MASPTSTESPTRPTPTTHRGQPPGKARFAPSGRAATPPAGRRAASTRRRRFAAPPTKPSLSERLHLRHRVAALAVVSEGPGEARQAKAGTVDPAKRADDRLFLIGVAASTIGLCLILFVGYLFVFTGLEQAREQRLMLNNFTTVQGAVALEGQTPAEGQPVGVLEIPAIHLEQVVVEGSSATDLMKGPGLMIGTAVPGTLGNSVIAGRRMVAGGPFSAIGTLRYGDVIHVVTGLGNFTYKVVANGTAADGDVDPVAPSKHGELTLVTSNPPLLATGRLYARAKLVSAPATAAFPAGAPTLTQRGLAGDYSAFAPTIAWGIILAIVIWATFTAYRRWRPYLWTVYLLTTPVIVAVALVWFSNVTRLLPATM